MTGFKKPPNISRSKGRIPVSPSLIVSAFKLCEVRAGH